MGVFEPEAVPLFTYESAKGLENAFKQKPTAIPLELPLRPVVFAPPKNDNVPIIMIGAITIIGLVGLFLAFFATRRKD